MTKNPDKKRDKNPDKKREKYVLGEVIGLESVKDEINYYMGFIKNSEKYKDWNVKLPKGIFVSWTTGDRKNIISKNII